MAKITTYARDLSDYEPTVGARAALTGEEKRLLLADVKRRLRNDIRQQHIRAANTDPTKQLGLVDSAIATTRRLEQHLEQVEQMATHETWSVEDVAFLLDLRRENRPRG